MTRHPARRPRSGSPLAVGAALPRPPTRGVAGTVAGLVAGVVAALLAASLAACGPAARADVPITVMTQNLYLGTSLARVFSATTDADLAAATDVAWGRLLASDPPARAAALADEVARLRPDVLGLQEVTLWRDQEPGDALANRAPDATHVVFDFLGLLQERLAARGTPYTAVATSTNADIELPRRRPDGALVDVRLTDRDALLVRTDRAALTSSPASGHYAAQFTEPLFGEPVASTRGWTSVDYRVGSRTTVRILESHLEVGGPGTGAVQERQARELAAMATRGPHPVVLIGDFNAVPADARSPAYRALTAASTDAWAAARPGDPGWSCCQPGDLAEPAGRLDVRIDLVLVPAGWPVVRIDLVGDHPFRAAPPPLWVSDHAGVVATVGVPAR